LFPDVTKVGVRGATALKATSLNKSSLAEHMSFLFWCGHDNWIHRHEFNNNHPKRISVTHSVVKKRFKKFRKTGFVTHKHLGCPSTSVLYEIVHKTCTRTEKTDRH